MAKLIPKPEQHPKQLSRAEAVKAHLALEAARQEKEARDAVKHRKELGEADAERRRKEEALAAKLKPECPHQKSVEARLTDKTTAQLGAAIREAAAHKQVMRWVSVSKAHARDCMARAYPLALQMGILSTPNDRDYVMKFHNGSVLEFAWPDKHSGVAA